MKRNKRVENVHRRKHWRRRPIYISCPDYNTPYWHQKWLDAGFTEEELDIFLKSSEEYERRQFRNYLLGVVEKQEIWKRK